MLFPPPHPITAHRVTVTNVPCVLEGFEEVF